MVMGLVAVGAHAFAIHWSYQAAKDVERRLSPYTHLPTRRCP